MRAGGLASALVPFVPFARAAAQAPASAPFVGVNATALATVGSPSDERARVRQLSGDSAAAGYLLRTPTPLVPLRLGVGTSYAVWFIAPEALVSTNSAIATPANDGALWAGRGVSTLVRAGIALRASRVTLVFDPEFTYAQNRGFQTVASGLTGQTSTTGPYAAPWYTGAYSADLPLRFGDLPYATLGWGQSRVSVDAGPLVAGVSSENQWWGPGVRNALLLGNSAEGMMHAFVQTARPLRTRIGDVEGRAIIGSLTPSLYFRQPAGSPSGRALSGAVVTLRPSADTTVTVGFERMVLTPVHSGFDVFGHALDVLYRNQNLGSGTTPSTPRSSDQLTGAFARWLLPSARSEVYAEFSRSELPRSVRQFLIAPLYTGAYTLGVAHGWRAPQGASVIVRAELTDLEQTRKFSDLPAPPDYYTGRAAPGGFTNRGQVLGAAIGPGSQSQYLGVDYYARTWQFGTFAERVRNQNDALYRQFAANLARHDVTLGGGVRGGLRLPALDVRGELAATNRLNYLFQNGQSNIFALGTVDVSNIALRFSLSPRAARQRQ